jgi:hypothetical protein
MAGEQYEKHLKFEHIFLCSHCGKQCHDRRSINKHQSTWDDRPCRAFKKSIPPAGKADRANGKQKS